MLERLFRGDDAGASSVEYGLVVFFIAATIVVIVFALGVLTQGTYKHTCDNVAVKVSPGTTCGE